MAIDVSLFEPAAMTSSAVVVVLVLFALAFHAAAGDPLIEGGVNDGAEDLDCVIDLAAAERLDAVVDVAVPRSAALALMVTLITLAITIRVTSALFWHKISPLLSVS
jgi:hypothetical protein